MSQASVADRRQRFADLAESYVALIGRHSELPVAQLALDVQTLFVELYRAAMDLDHPEPSDEDLPSPSHERWTQLYQSLSAKFGEANTYAEIFDPYDRADESPVRGSLADDLADVYRDLLHGLEGWRVGRRDDAVWQWYLDFQTHWGKHVTDALRPLHALTFDHGFAEGGDA